MSEKIKVKVLQVDECTYRIEINELVLVVSTVDKSEEACVNAYAFVYGIASMIEVMNYARELRETMRKSMEGVM